MFWLICLQLKLKILDIILELIILFEEIRKEMLNNV